MKQLFIILALALVLGLLVSTLEPWDRLRDGDTISPVLASPTVWYAGGPNDLKVRLRAVNKDGSGPRALDFNSVPYSVNPRATITFYKGEAPEPPLTVTLHHRC